MKDTIFIVITRGFIIRNILRSGVLKRLLDAGKRVVVFIPLEKTQKNLPDYLHREFAHEDVILVGVPLRLPRGHSFFSRISNMLVYTDSTWMYGQIGSHWILDRAWFWKYVEYAVFSVLSIFTPLKWFIRYIERNYFFVSEYGAYFDTYKPSVLFSTSIVSKFDVMFMKEAARRGVKTISMPKGWDNVTKTLYRFIPDMLIVQCEIMKERAAALQRVPKDKITVTGFPQFDWYTRKDILKTREEFMGSLGLDPSRKLIFFGSEGAWARNEAAVVRSLVKMIDANAFPSRAALLIRPHFSDIKADRFKEFRGLPNVKVDDSITISDFFDDNWDPQMDQIVFLTNLIHHADVTITTASTLTLDAACANKPVINLFYGSFVHPKTGKDQTALFYISEHYAWVLETGALYAVYSDDELKNAITKSFLNPKELEEERKVLVERLCFGNDGHSADRVARAVLALSRNGATTESSL